LSETAPGSAAPGLAAAEAKRKLVHVGVGGFALLLRFLSWPQAAAMALAALLLNWQLLPRVGGRALWRRDELERGFPPGILLYPASVLGLILVFREDLWKAAALWGVLALGDGMASVVGLSAGGPRLPWNPAKSWSGFAAFVFFGSLGATALAGWTRAEPVGQWPGWLWLGVSIALVCALVESAPTGLDDNLTVPMAGAAALVLLLAGRELRLLDDPELGRRALLGLLINLGVGLAAWRKGSIDVPGAVSAVLIGIAISAGLGLGAYAQMLCFFVVGSAVTRLGYDIKAARGIAQERGGARGWRNAWANGGVPALLAVFAGLAAPPWSEWLALGYAAAVATATADTCSSEIGKAWGRRTFLITTLRPVPPGTEGAVSLEGTLAGLAGGLLIGATGAALGVHSWPAALLVAGAGLAGSLAESLIGSVAERRGWLDNDQLNALNTAIGAAIAIAIARLPSH
jgi:uncharacterized protein (TIGR00297 family)